MIAKCISNKSDDILAHLRRIPAENVIRIEIRDGATLGIPDLSGQLAGVIAQNVGLRGQWAYRTEFRAVFTDPLLTRFETHNDAPCATGSRGSGYRSPYRAGMGSRRA